MDFVILWDLDDKDNFENKKLIKRLKVDEKYYHKFMQQKKLKDSTADYVMDRLNLLEKKIGELL